MEAWFLCEYITQAFNTKNISWEWTQFPITQQYNGKMRGLPPEYDIEVEIIERISTNDDVISASKAREFLVSRDFGSYKSNSA